MEKKGNAGWGARGIAALLALALLLLLPSFAWAAMLPGKAGVVINAPSDAEVTLYERISKTQGVEYAYDEARRQADGTTDYVFYKTINDSMYYQVGGADYVTVKGSVPSGSGANVKISREMLKPEGKTKTTLDRDLNSNSGANMADLYLNINAEGCLRLAAGETFQLVSKRNWWGSNVTWVLGGTYRLIEPDYHYTVLDLDGKPANDVVAVNDNGLLRAVGNGTAIVLVSYDAMTLNYHEGAKVSYEGYDPNGFYGAIWPENTGVFVVSVGGFGSIDTGLTINEGKNIGRNKEAGDKLDSELDVIYFTGEQGKYEFTPNEPGVSVSVANPFISDNKLGFKGFVQLTADENGRYTVPLTNGRNIIKLEKGTKTAYQVVTARQTGVTVNGRPLDKATLCPGEDVVVVLDTVFNPVTRMSLYNTDAGLFYFDVSGYPGLHAGNDRGSYGFYFWASCAAKHIIDSFAVDSHDDSGYANSAISTTDVLTVPKDYDKEYFTLSDGVISVGGFGADYGAHRAMNDLPPGNKPNTSAFMGSLPDITVPIVELKGISVTKQPALTTYNLGDVFDPAGMVVTADYGDFSEDVTDFTCDSSVFTDPGINTVNISYTRGNTTKTTSVNVMVTNIRLDRIGVSVHPTKRMYEVGDVFDPAGMVVTAVYSDNSRRNLSTYTCSQTPLTAADKTVAIAYGNKQTNAKIIMRVVEKVEITTPPSQTIYTVGEYFKESGNGMAVTVTYNDGSKEQTTIYSVRLTGPLALDDKFVEIHYMGEDKAPNLQPARQSITVLPDPNKAEETGKPSITAYVSYSSAGKFVLHNGSWLWNKPVTVYDDNSDGKYTMGEAFAALHEQYFYGGRSGYEESMTDQGGWVNKFWGDSSGNISYCLNDSWVSGSHIEIKDGDKLAVFAYDDVAQYTDLYTWFGKSSYEGKVKTELKFTVNGLSVMQSSADKAVTALPVGASVAVYDSNDIEVLTLKATVDKDGGFTIVFPEAGEYTLEVYGVCDYTVTGYNGASATHKGAKVVPARCSVKVTE